MLLCLSSLGLFGSDIPPIPEHLDLFCPSTYGELLPLQPASLQSRPNHKNIDPIHVRGKIVQQNLTEYIIEDGAIESNNLLLLADRIRYDKVTNFLEANGNIRFECADFRLTCKQLTMDWNNKTGQALDLQFELPPDWILLSDKVKFNGLKHWQFNKVELNPSFQENPGWKCMASNLKVDLERYAYFNNLWLWVGGLPTHYFLPYGIYPVKMQRASGLLPIAISLFGDRKSITIPYYMVLGDKADVTVLPKFYFRKSMSVGLDVKSRWNPELNHKGSIEIESIKTDLNNHKTGRYLNFQEAWQREDGWQLLGDINLTSNDLLDCNYSSDSPKFGGRPYNSFFSISKIFPWGVANIGAAQQKKYLLSKSDADVLSVQRDIAPSIQYLFRPLLVGSWYVDGNMRIDHLGYSSSLDNIPNDDHYVFSRYNIFLKATKSFGTFVNLQTSSRFTRYSASFDELSNKTLVPSKRDSHPSQRIVNSVKVELSGPTIGRKFNKVSFMDKLWEVDHLLTPYSALLCTSSPSIRWRNPNFDNIDLQPGIDWSAEGELSAEFGIKQHFLYRSNAGTPFLDLLRWKLFTKYNFNEIMLPNLDRHKGWDSLNNDINLEINNKFRINFRKSIIINSNGYDDYASAEYDVGDKGNFNFAFFSTKSDSTKSDRLLIRQKGIQMGGLYRFCDDRVRLEFLCNYDYNQKCFTNIQTALAYVQPCIAETISFQHLSKRVYSKPNKRFASENRIMFTVTLSNIGDFLKLKHRLKNSE